MALKTNWEHLVGYHQFHNPECDRIYTCAFCGDMKAPNKRFTDITFMFNAIHATTNIFTGTSLQSTYINIYNAIKLYARQDSEEGDSDKEGKPSSHSLKEDSCSICVCINCYYWTSRHHDNNLIPTMYLKWYMNTLHSGSCKCFDKRVLYRIARTLLQTHKGYTNFYLTMFNAAEIESIGILAANGLNDIAVELHNYYTTQTAGSLFFDHKLAAKCVRDKRHNDCAEKKNV